jgi:hypothetical protein
MKRSINSQPLLHASVGMFIFIFLTEKYISTPAFLGLRNFSVDELIDNSYEMTGDGFYCLYEKSYRLAGSNSYVNVKNYFSNNEFISNGVDFTGGRICTELSRFCKKYERSMLVHSIELLLDDSLDFGSLIVNRFLDLRFGKLESPAGKKKFHLTGISTDYEHPSGKIEREISTHGARIMKEEVSFYRALEKFKREPAIKELVTCVMKNFPHAISPIESSEH